MDAVIAEEAMMSPEQKMLYELMGGREAHMRNVMQNYNSDGDFIGPGGRNINHEFEKCIDYC